MPHYFWPLTSLISSCFSVETEGGPWVDRNPKQQRLVDWQCLSFCPLPAGGGGRLCAGCMLVLLAGPKVLLAPPAAVPGHGFCVNCRRKGECLRVGKLTPQGGRALCSGAPGRLARPCSSWLPGWGWPEIPSPPACLHLLQWGSVGLSPP